MIGALDPPQTFTYKLGDKIIEFKSDCMVKIFDTAFLPLCFKFRLFVQQYSLSSFHKANVNN